MEEINIRSYAYIGDAVWELYIREQTVFKEYNARELHKKTTCFVKASYQAGMLNLIEKELTEEEHEISRRARNIEVPVARRSNQVEYRHATAFEALIGWWYLNDKERLEYILKKFGKIYD